MSPIHVAELPDQALLCKYRSGGAYADCYFTEVAGSVSHSAYVEAFYTTWLFKVERALLKWFAARPSTDTDAQRLANAATDAFAAWRVEGRSRDQLLLADFTGSTRSWLMVAPTADGTRTRLYFGSAVVPAVNKKTGKREHGLLFHALLGFHRLYSRALLSSAGSRLSSRRRQTG
jgi:hypothetical protein